MARFIVKSTAAGSAGPKPDTLRVAVDTAVAAAVLIGTADASAEILAIETAVAAADATENLVVDIDLATVTNLNKLKTALAAVYNQVVQSGKLTN